MNKLLNIFLDTILPLLIIIIAIIVAFFLFKHLQKKFNKPLDTTPKASTNAQVKLKSKFCTEEEMIFLEALHRALPRDCISFPHIGVTQLVEPKGSMNDYKAIVDKYVDIVIFLRKDMKPILAIDLYHPSPVAQQLKKFDDNISNVLKAAKIPVLHKQIQNSYNIEDLMVEVLNSLDGATVTYLKGKSIQDSVK